MTPQKLGLLLAGLTVLNFVTFFEASTFEFLLPVVGTSLDLSLSQTKNLLLIFYAAVISTFVYLLAMGSQEKVSWRSLKFGGLLFMAGSFFLAINLGEAQVFVARGLQGIGSAFIAVYTPAVIAQTFRNGQYLGVSPYLITPFSLGSGMLLGPSFGEWILSALGIEAFIVVLVLLTAIGGLIVRASFNSEADDEIAGSSLYGGLKLRFAEFDVCGVLGALIFVCAALQISNSTESLANGVADLGVTILALVFGLGLLLNSVIRSPYSFLDRYFLFTESNIGLLNVGSCLSFASTYVVAYILPFYIFYVIAANSETLWLGGTIVFVPLGMIFSLCLIPFLSILDEYKKLLAASGIQIVACLGFFWASQNNSVISLLAAGFCMGLVRGAFIVPFNFLTLHTIPVYRIQETSIYNSLARYLGMGVGVAIGAAILNSTDNYSLALTSASVVAGIIACFSQLVISMSHRLSSHS